MSYGAGGVRGATYRSNDVMSRPPGALIVLLYQRLLVELRKADRQIADGDISGRGESLGRASAIVFELLASLDIEAGGELGSRLSALYSYFIREIQEVERDGDRNRLRRLVDIISPLHESWVQASRLSQSGEHAILPDEPPA